MEKLGGSVNLKNKAFGQFFDYEFNSICERDGRYFMATDEGLFEITGKKDVEANIDASFDTLVSDWGVSRVKRPRFLRLAMLADNPVQIDVLDKNDTVLGSAVFTPTAGVLSLESIRESIGRLASGLLFKFRIKNIEGSFFHIKSLHALFTMKSHGCTKNT